MTPSPPSQLTAPRADADVPAYWQALGLPGLADLRNGARLLGLESADA